MRSAYAPIITKVSAEHAVDIPQTLAPLLALRFREALTLGILHRARLRRPLQLIQDALLLQLSLPSLMGTRSKSPLARARVALTAAALSAAGKSDFAMDQWITFHCVPSRHFGAWIHTHGLYLFRKPELEVFGVSHQEDFIFAELLNLAQYLAKGATIKDGDTSSPIGGGCFVRFTKHDSADARRHFGTSVLELAYIERRGHEIVTPVSRAAAVVFHQHGVPPDLIQDLVSRKRVRDSERRPRNRRLSRVYVETPRSLLESRRNTYSQESRAFRQGHVKLVDWCDDVVLARATEKNRRIFLKELADIRSAFLRSSTHVRGVSVVIPVGGEGSSVVDTLESISRQAFLRYRPRDIQVVLVIDGPRTWQGVGGHKGKMVALLRRLPREVDCVVVRLRQQYGRATARNLGCHLAKHDVVAFVDSSMVLTEHVLTDHMVRHQRLFGRMALLGFKQNITRSRFSAKRAEVESGSFKPSYRGDWKWTHSLGKGEAGFEWQGRTYVPGDEIGYLDVTGDLQKLNGLVRIGHRSLPTFFQSNLVTVSLAAVKDVGGFESRFDGLWGFEDSYLGALLFARGTHLVPCPSAVAFKIEHQEDSTKSFDIERHRALYDQLVESADMSQLTQQRFRDRVAALYAANAVEDMAPR